MSYLSQKYNNLEGSASEKAIRNRFLSFAKRDVLKIPLIKIIGSSMPVTKSPIMGTACGTATSTRPVAAPTSGPSRPFTAAPLCDPLGNQP